MNSWWSVSLKFLLGLVVLFSLAIFWLLHQVTITNPAVMIKDALGIAPASQATETLPQQLRVPAGFSLTRFAAGLGKVRFLETTATGDLLASRPRDGDILLLRKDANGDGMNDGQITLVQNLDYPHGLLVHDGWLYIAETGQVGRIAFNPDDRAVQGEYQVLVTGLPTSGGHRTKSIAMYKNALLVSIGSSCNVCMETDIRRATVMRFNLDGSGGEIFASGLRNSVGLDVAPWSGDLYATDNGRDLLGDDYPVCELNLLEKGRFYGWPYVNGFGDTDPDYGDRYPAQLPPAMPPVFGFRAHNAPLGIHFLRNPDAWPDAYQRSALVALHGSWNRSEPDGYKVVALHWNGDGTITSTDFLVGFESRGNVIGRPVDIAEDSRGCVYISDDYSGNIYRSCYQPTAPDGVESANLQ